MIETSRDAGRCLRDKRRLARVAVAGYATATCCSSARRINTERDELPESIHTSSVSLDLAAASAPFQPFGFTSDQSSAADFSNQTFEPCFSIKSAVLRTIWASRIGSPLAS
jgi:peroxiredoxin